MILRELNSTELGLLTELVNYCDTHGAGLSFMLAGMLEGALYRAECNERGVELDARELSERIVARVRQYGAVPENFVEHMIADTERFGLSQRRGKS